MKVPDESAFWAELAALEPERIEPPLRRRVAAAWAETGRGEHASVASFGRFALELLAIGAPPELLAAAHRAALDEILHARLAFAIASRYAGSPLGPGAMPLGDTFGVARELTAITLAAVREGCIAETLSAIEAAAARDVAEPPAVQSALAIIARDEAAHADLAWSFARWALDRGDAALKQTVAATLASELAREAHAPALSGVADAALVPFGQLDAAHRKRVRAHALGEILRPAALALVAPLLL